jgi:hypothetical protein
MFDLKMDTSAKRIKYRRLVRAHGPLKVTSTIVQFGLFRRPVATWKELARLSAILTAEQRAVRQRVTTPQDAITPRPITPGSTPTAVTPKSPPSPWNNPKTFLVSTPVCAGRSVARKVFNTSKPVTKIQKCTTPTASPKSRIVARSPMSSRSQMSPSAVWNRLSPDTPRINVCVDPHLQFPSNSPSVTPRALTY